MVRERVETHSRDNHSRVTPLNQPVTSPENSAADSYAAKTMQTNNQPSIGQLLSEISTDMSTLVRKEIELARAETSEKISRATRSATILVAGGLVAYAGVIVMLIAAAILLGAVMPYWLSSLIVGLVVLVIGAVMIVSGKNTIANMSVVPEKTVQTLQEDAQWAKEQVR